MYEHLRDQGTASRGEQLKEAGYWLLRTLDRQLVGIRESSRDGGSSGVRDVLATMGPVLAGLFESDARKQAEVRLFEMRPQDLPAWDHYQKIGSGGFSYGTVLDSRGKFASNVQIRETPSGSTQVGARSVDPASLLAAVGQLKLQADLARIESKIDSNLQLSEEILWQLVAHDRAEVASAADTIGRTFEGLLFDGSVSFTDWQRVASLEQPLKRTGLKAAEELERIARRLAVDTVSEAMQVHSGDAARALELVDLLTRIQAALKQWTAIHLSVLSTEREITPSAVRRELERERNETHRQDALRVNLHRAVEDVPVQARGQWERLRADGMVFGRLRDDRTVRRVRRERSAVRRGLENSGPAFLEPVPVRLALPASHLAVGSDC